MKPTKHLVWAFWIFFLACEPRLSDVVEPAPVPSQDEALRPGLHKLTPYDFKGGSLVGMRWLENHVNANPRAPSAQRARAWLLRARLDWVVRAYLAPDLPQRVAELRDLMVHLNVEPPAEGVDEDSLEALWGALERQAQEVERAPAYAPMAQSARELVGVFRHLDQSPEYFGHLAALRGALGGDTSPLGAGAFAPEGLMVALVDVGNGLRQWPKLEPAQRPHALARLAPWSCPKGFLAYGAAAPEDREAALLGACAFPCPKGQQGGIVERAAPCSQELAGTQGLFTLDNEVSLRSLRELRSLQREGEGLLQRADARSSSQGRELALKQALVEVSGLVLGLEPPCLKGGCEVGEPFRLRAPQAKAVSHPGIKPVVWVASAQGVRVATQPSASASDEPLALTMAGGLAPWAWPGKQAAFGWGEVGGEGWGGKKAALLADTDELCRAYEGALKLPAKSLTPELVAPALLLPTDAPAKHLVALAEALREGGYPLASLIVYDQPLDRVGVLPLELTPARDDEPLVVLRPDALELVAKKGAPRKTFPRAPGAPLPPAFLQEVLALKGGFADTIPRLGLALDPNATYGDALALIEALRFQPGADLKPWVEAFGLTDAPKK